jgi:K+:H+ antiporter
MLFGLPPLPAFLVGATLALSSTAVVARLIRERDQQNCPVGLTATILIFQDVAAIFLLIVAGALGSRSAVLPAIGLAMIKAMLAFGVAVLSLVSWWDRFSTRSPAAATRKCSPRWRCSWCSLQGGRQARSVCVAETPFRAIIQAEIKPFRGLFLEFFFISVGLSLDLAMLMRLWPWVIGVATLLITVKIATNVAASLAFG